VFDGSPAVIETGKEPSGAWIDVIFYRGAEREIDFRKVKTAGALFALSIDPHDGSRETKSPAVLEVSDGRFGNDVPIPGRRGIEWDRPAKPSLRLTTTAVPFRTSDQRAGSSAQLGSTNRWKVTGR
jgi:hypothetical protein